MEEMYWISVLGNIQMLGIVLMCFSLCVFSVALITIAIEGYDKNDSKSKCKLLKTSGVVSIIAILMTVLIPSKQQLYAIYGIGSIIDYVQSNDKAKQLPNKVIDALDTWLEQNKK